MKAMPPIIALLVLSTWGNANSEIAEFGSQADKFVTTLLRKNTGTETCRDEFDARFLLRFDYADGTSRKWEEPDAREPDVTNHVMEWTFPGYRLVTFTFFSFYGPSTWVRQLEISAPTELPNNLRFGGPIEEFSETLGLSRNLGTDRGITTGHADLAFVTDDDGKVQSIILECVAD